MDFWIGLSVGMHLGKILADYLERVGLAYGLLSPETDMKLDKLQEVVGELGGIIHHVADD